MSNATQYETIQLQNQNVSKLGLEHGKLITYAQLLVMLKSLGIYFDMFIDSDTKDEFNALTGFHFHHQYDGCQTYKLTDWR